MGKFRSNLKGQSKGKRWPKGQSSSSNPITQKYRSLAKSSFFQENLGAKSGLTRNALHKHDAMQSFTTPTTGLGELAESLNGVNLDDDNISQSATESATQTCGTFRTFQTFASDWSECTNASFTKLLNGFKSDSALHKEMLAILAAITELLKEKNGKQTSTEYYMALIEILSADQEENGVHATLSLLSMGIKSVPESVLRLRFAESSKIFMDLLEKHCNSENQNLLRCLLGCISVQLRSLDHAHWTNSSTLQMFDTIVAFTIHSKPKLRKAAQHAVCAIMRGSSFMLQAEAPKMHPAAGRVAKFCLHQMKPELQSSSQTTILHILTLLKDVMYIFPKDDIKTMCEKILSTMTANNILVRTCCLQTLHALFLMSSENKQKNLTDDDMIDMNNSKRCSTNLTSTLAAKLVKALYDYRPDKSDIRQTIAWVTVMQQGHISLASLDPELCMSMLPNFVTTCTMELWLSDQVDIANAGTIALREVLYECVSPACTTLLGVQKHKSLLEKIFQTISKALTIPFGHAAENVVNILAVCFEVAGRNCANLLSDPLKALGERRDPSAHSMNKSSLGQIDHAIATAVKTMGPEFLLQCIPLTTESGDISIDRSWLLPILRDKIRGSTLEFFGSHILHLASICKQKSEKHSQEGKKNDAITYDLLCSQLWGLFPGFCNCPTDITESFKKIAKVLGDTLMQRPELRSSVLQGLRKLINSAEGEEINELARFAKNYLPLLLNIYTTPSQGGYEQGQRLSALETIQIYLTITPSEKGEEIFKNLLAKLDEANKSEDSFLQEALLDICRTMSVYQTEETIKELFTKFLLPLCDPVATEKPKKEKTKNTLQKKAFRILEDVLKSDKDGCKEFTTNNRKQLQSVIMKSLNNSAENSRATRLRSLEILVKSQPQLDCDSKLIKSCITEAVLSTKDINSKCRDCAQRLLISVGEVLESKKNGLSDYVNTITAGLAGTPHMAAATLQALASITYHFSGALGKETLQFLLNHACTLLASPSREITVAAVNYIIVYIKALPAPQVALVLQQIMNGVSSMSEDCRRHARLELGKLLNRMSRRYTADTLTKLTPTDDIVTHKRLRNLRKQQSREKRLKESKSQAVDENDELVDARPSVKSIEEILADSDSDEDMCDEDIRKPKGQKSNKTNKNKGKSLIHETEDSIIDLVDVSAASKILSSKPESLTSTIKTKTQPNRGFKTASDGRLVIENLEDSSDEEGQKKSKSRMDMDSDSDSNDDMKDEGKPTLGKRKRSDLQSQKSGLSGASGVSGPRTKYHAGGHGIHRSLSGASVKSGFSGKSNRSAATTSKSGFGSEYRSSKAAGDVKRKGRPDPYAYVPLSRSSLNKRKRAKNAGQFRGIVKSAKKGAALGTKLKKKKF